ncbi:MAG: hypothetical protein GY847_17745, partial [Proteobacteria bacterium]|nr:hypothetical protein [Pseudomonadota bacterium]
MKSLLSIVAISVFFHFIVPSPARADKALIWVGDIRGAIEPHIVIGEMYSFLIEDVRMDVNDIVIMWGRTLDWSFTYTSSSGNEYEIHNDYIIDHPEDQLDSFIESLDVGESVFIYNYTHGNMCIQDIGSDEPIFYFNTCETGLPGYNFKGRLQDISTIAKSILFYTNACHGGEVLDVLLDEPAFGCDVVAISAAGSQPCDDRCDACNRNCKDFYYYFINEYRN